MTTEEICPSESVLKPKEETVCSVERIFYRFFLHASDLPNYYQEEMRDSPFYLQYLIDDNKFPEVKFAADFTDWRQVETSYIEPDLMSRHDYYKGTDYNLWPAFYVDFILPPGQFQYKFVVDGNWVNTKQAPLIFDSNGNLNNFIDTGRLRWKKKFIDEAIKYENWNLISVESSFFNGHYHNFDMNHYSKQYS